MNSPYMGNFKVTQEYKGATHDGLDLVGQDSKNIHSTVTALLNLQGGKIRLIIRRVLGSMLKLWIVPRGTVFILDTCQVSKLKQGTK